MSIFQALVRARRDLGAGVHGPGVAQGDFLKRGSGIENPARLNLMAKATARPPEGTSPARLIVWKRLVSAAGRGGTMGDHMSRK